MENMVNAQNKMLLKVDHLKKYYKTKRQKKKQVVKAVDDVSFYLNSGQSFAIIGQSGSGKSTLLKLVFGLEKPDEGKVDLLCKVGIVFQDPYASLCPSMKIFDIVAEPVTMHGKMKDKVLLEKMVKESLQAVGLDYDAIYRRYPHQVSGGQKQRVAIARALITKPKLLVLDEPTSMLDADVKSEIVNILQNIKSDIAILLVTHDITLATELCDYIFVMKDGIFIEHCFANELIKGAKEDYTKNLILAAMDIESYWNK